ncbi:hypothetical protein Hanom_Chr17g01552551 [Helianthus anomalus]
MKGKVQPASVFELWCLEDFRFDLKVEWSLSFEVEVGDVCVSGRCVRLVGWVKRVTWY